ncbi:MAG: hypothetical protein A2381_08250 [Bdellovibrionales bacterium RIFOXYB1_FULL_37_110]|nr:MAG: hypothetical protein A2417_06435 [Bdellovibrionales bacterium RIFOXYC1_FULL_37_79]OFZ60074.1 MAG: hypothetical protein A2381_08250 [Bdellovibrionales bacterium RIFOXYB1_FULL_37_110]OFZ64930.1 MAG: hypothetical protein A2577_02130 [Bdellovibrionales bacterium RIFOXYD1_FULL_36_51]
MQIKRITDLSELDRFRILTNKHIHVLFPMDYLAQSRVFGCYDSRECLCGGFVLVMKGPFRVLESIPAYVEDRQGLDIDKTCEVTGLWFSPSAKDRSKSIVFWIRLYFEIIKTQKQFFVYAFSMSKPQIGKMYEPARPVRLFAGQTHVLPGMEDQDTEVVEFVRRKDLLLFPLKSPDFLYKRARHTLGHKIKRARLFFKKQYA